MSSLNENQAYAAMFHFLQGIYERTQSDDLGGLLGGMSLLADGSTADPAAAADWKNAVAFALRGGKADLLGLTPPNQSAS